jgi:hypothetical protein
VGGRQRRRSGAALRLSAVPQRHQIGDAGAAALSEALKSNATLTTL